MHRVVTRLHTSHGTYACRRTLRRPLDFIFSEDPSMKQSRRRHKSEGQALDKPNYEHIKPPKVTKKTKTKKELENQELVRRRIS